MAVRAALEVNKRSLLTSLTAASALLFSAGAALATDKPVLTIHTYDSFASEWGPGPAVEKAFEENCNCDLQFVALDSSIGILGRVQLEGSSSKADIVLGLDDEARHLRVIDLHGIQDKDDLSLIHI